MSIFPYRNGILCVEEVALPDIAARFGTPCYVYSRSALETNYRAFRDALGGRESLICYAVKANSNLAILNLFARLGAGFDVVSGGELTRVLAAGGDPGKIVFSGVGKSEAELRQALRAGVYCLNVESSSELERLNRVAHDLGVQASVALRVNPDVDPKTHPYISTGLRSNKFGVPFEEALGMYRRARELGSLRILGVACHIGSQLLDPAPSVEAAAKIAALADALRAEGIALLHLDLGGGMGIRYRDETPPALGDYVHPILEALSGRPEKLVFEPGRSLVGNAGLLLTRIEYLKHGTEKNFAIVDAAMNDLIRPALYDAWHDILPVGDRRSGGRLYEIVGPVCESGDFLGHARSLSIEENDLLAVMSAGAYSMAMSSNYNSRPRAAEVLVDGKRMLEIRKRETPEQLFALETRLT